MATKLLFILAMVIGSVNAQSVNVVRGDYDSSYYQQTTHSIGLFSYQSADTIKIEPIDIIYTPKHYTTMFNDTIVQLKLNSYSIDGGNAIINYQFVYSRGATLTFQPITIPYGVGTIIEQLARFIQLSIKYQ